MYVTRSLLFTDQCHSLGKFTDTLDSGRRTTDVSEGVAVVVIATKGEIDPAHKRQSLIDNDDFLVMSPKEDIRLDVIRVTKYLKNHDP